MKEIIQEALNTGSEMQFAGRSDLAKQTQDREDGPITGAFDTQLRCAVFVVKRAVRFFLCSGSFFSCTRAIFACRSVQLYL